MTMEDTPITIELLDLTVTDIDDVYPAGFTLTVLPGDNYGVDSTTITPSTNFAGIIQVPVYVNDGDASSQIDTVNIIVAGINDPPAVFPDYYTVPEDSVVTVSNSAGILTNDIDPEGDQITAELIDDVDHGVLSFDSDGSFTYRPAPDYSGIDQFIYRAVDDEGMYSEVGTVTIGINATNDVPIAFNDNYSFDEDDTLAVLDSLGVLTNDFDADPDQILSSFLISNVSHGTLFTSDSVSEQISVGNTFNGLFLYHPDQDYYGTDEFIYAAFDGYAQSNLDTVAITIGPVNDAPELVILDQETKSALFRGKMQNNLEIIKNIKKKH